MTYFRRVLISIDQCWNVILGGDCEDETISSAVGRKAIEGRRWALIAEHCIDWLFYHAFGEVRHCRANIEWDER